MRLLGLQEHERLVGRICPLGDPQGLPCYLESNLDREIAEPEAMLMKDRLYILCVCPVDHHFNKLIHDAGASVL